MVGLLASAGIASAHVTVSSPDAAPGGYGKVTFRVPERERHGQHGEDPRSSSRPRRRWPRCASQPVPGWTVTPTKAPLNPPVETDDGDTITERVSVVEFDAAAGGGIAPGQFQEFSLSGGPFPKVDSLALPRRPDLQRR